MMKFTEETKKYGVTGAVTREAAENSEAIALTIESFLYQLAQMGPVDYRTLRITGEDARGYEGSDFFQEGDILLRAVILSAPSDDEGGSW